MLLLYILWHDWPILMISGSNEQLQQQLEYTLLKPDCHSWWISKMQSATLEEQYAIKFCFELGMFQTAFRRSCMNQASVFEWHKRFKEGRESVRDDKRCGWSKEVNTPELIGQIKNFMEKDCCVSIETISAQFDVSVGTVHTIICEELKMWKICANFVPRVLREDQKERHCHDSRLMIKLINSDPQFLMLWWPAMKAGSIAMTQWPRDRLLMIPFLDSTGMIYMHWVPTGQTVNKEYYVEVLNPVNGISSRTIHQSTTPSLSQAIWPRWASRQFLTLPIVQTLLPVTFAYSLSSEAVVMRQLRRWNRLWQMSLTRSHKRTSMGPPRSCWNGTSALQPEEITLKGTRILCVYYQ